MEEREESVVKKELFCTHLLMRKTELVLQDLLSIREELDLICKNVKVISQVFDDFIIVNVVEGHDVVACAQRNEELEALVESWVGCLESFACRCRLLTG